MMYQSAHFQSATPLALSVLADTVLNPAFLPEELELQRDATRYELRELSTKPELVLPEVLHKVAYGGQGLGNSLLCPTDRVELIDEAMLRKYMDQYYRPERIVIAGAGMPHEELVEQTEKAFSFLKSSPLNSELESREASQQVLSSRQSGVPPHLLSSNPPSNQLQKTLSRAASYLYPQSTETDSHSLPPSLVSGYVGGQEFIHDSETKFNHVYLAWEGPGLHSPDIYAMATIQMLLGGGGSFSAGGPGKGMYSRLYTHILNYHPDIDHCEAFHHIYTDSSLIGLFASCLPPTTRRAKSPSQVLPHLVHQISLLLHEPIKPAELSKAKNQLKSSLVMALESRAVEVEDLGRQVRICSVLVVPISDASCQTLSLGTGTQPQDPRFRNVRQDRRAHTRGCTQSRTQGVWRGCCKAYICSHDGYRRCWRCEKGAQVLWRRRSIGLWSDRILCAPAVIANCFAIFCFRYYFIYNYRDLYSNFIRILTSHLHAHALV